MCFLHLLQRPLSFWLPRLLVGPFQTFQDELKTSTGRAGGAPEGKWEGGLWKGGSGWKVNPEKYAVLWSVTFKMTAGLGQRSGSPGP